MCLKDHNGIWNLANLQLFMLILLLNWKLVIWPSMPFKIINVRNSMHIHIILQFRMNPHVMDDIVHSYYP